jgi:tRNA pseudouridine13 synthase
MTHTFQFDELPCAYPILPVSGDIRTVPQDFVVDEQLGFTSSGDGEHIFLLIRKKGRNTEDVARILARFAGITRKSVSYAGLKDRNAVTTQYFSVHLPGKQDPDWQALKDPAIEVLSVSRHQKKLRRGALSRNEFCLLIREFSGNKDDIESRLHLIKMQGVPNYFASQRFGINANNLVYAEKLLLKGLRVKDRFKRNIYYSAARSWLFNLVLAERIRSGSWNRAVAGDSMMLNGSRSVFNTELLDEEIINRVNEFDIHPTAPLWGSGDTMVTAKAAAIENTVLSDWQDWTAGLEKARMQLARRAMRVQVTDLSWDWPEKNQLQLIFSLPPGCYATAVLRELGAFTEPEKK